MSDGEVQRRRIASAGDLQAVVRTMKAVAASNIGQHERSVLALVDYVRTVELGLTACLRDRRLAALPVDRPGGAIGAIVFGSDQGLVGRFNEVVADFAVAALKALPGEVKVWAVGERVHERLEDLGMPLLGRFAVPDSVEAIAPLVGQIQLQSEARRAAGEYTSLHLFHNRPRSGTLYEPVSQRLLPLDAAWQRGLADARWPTGKLPEVIGDSRATVGALVREYLFVTLFRACAESMASENASRLAAMQRADQNIDSLLDRLHAEFHRQRQAGIDDELFDLIAGFEAMAG